MLRTASTIVALPSGSKPKTLTIEDVHPSISKQQPTTQELTSMNGLRLPNLDVERSARAPMMGWIRRDDNGPAIQINDVRDFVRPRLSRYGVQ